MLLAWKQTGEPSLSLSGPFAPIVYLNNFQTSRCCNEVIYIQWTPPIGIHLGQMQVGHPNGKDLESTYFGPPTRPTSAG